MNLTYYDILELSENASEEVIKMAYKALAKKYHPDVFKGNLKEAEEKMKQINTAFEVLSNEQKRREYDAFLRNRRNYTHTESKQTAKPNNAPANESTFPSGKKSGWIIGILLFISFTQTLKPYNDAGLYDYAWLLGAIDFCLLSIIMMVVPILTFILTDLSPKRINVLCAANSVGVLTISLILYFSKVLPAMFVGWVIALVYYFINKHILLQIKKYAWERKKLLVAFFIILAILLATILGGQLWISNISKDNTSSSVQHNRPSFYVDIAQKVYDLRGYEQCAIVRTITLFDEFTADYVFALMEYENFDEEAVIRIMDEYGEDQGGGEGYLIEPNDYVKEIDTWCFDNARNAGDIAIIETAYGYSICYISAIYK